tara:strand:+ start:666 stop:839 length:174 start_codon:yes stop_codon:yes gene_type:complete
MKATLNFKSRKQANDFARAWTRKSLMGHTVSKHSVEIYDITEDLKSWVDDYVARANQ